MHILLLPTHNKDKLRVAYMHDVCFEQNKPPSTRVRIIYKIHGNTPGQPPSTAASRCLSTTLVWRCRHSTKEYIQRTHWALSGGQSIAPRHKQQTPTTPNPQLCTSLNGQKKRPPRRNRPHSFQKPRSFLLKQTAHDSPPAKYFFTSHHNSPLTIQDSMSQQLLRASRVR